MAKKQIQATTLKQKGKLLAIASTENEDRVGDSLLMKDWDLSKFKANPVLQAGHDYRPEFTIGIAENIRVENNQLVFEPMFHDLTQLARDVKAMYEAEPPILKAWSVGFIPKEFASSGKHELLEVSAVAVPANADCITMAKSYGEKEVKVIKSWLEKAKEKLLPMDEDTGNGNEAETIAEKLDESDLRDKKYEMIKDVDNITYAFYDVFMDDETPVEKFGELVSEMSRLLQELSTGNKEYVSDLLKDFTGSVLRKELLEKVEEIVEEKAEEEPKEGDVCKLPDGTEGFMEMDAETNNLVCKAKVEEKAVEPKEGDACTCDDGTEGVLSMIDEQLACQPKKEKAVEEAKETPEEKMMKAVEELTKCVSAIKDTTVALEKTATMQAQAQNAKRNGDDKGRTVKTVNGQQTSKGEVVVLRALQKIASNANKALHDLKK